ncbi:hypothetical protein A2U01_0074720, partial [Trifolium medium]|nr:hypothetical protein [Trifolium medium]
VPEKEKSPNQVMTGNASDDNTIVNSQGDESMKTISAHLGDSEHSETTMGAEAHIIDLDDLTSGERSIEITPAPSIAKRLRRILVKL